MLKVAAKKEQDRTTQLIYRRLKKRFPNLPEEISKVVYRYHLKAYRIRLIDPIFAGMSESEREVVVDDILDSLPEKAQRWITLLLLLTPEEANDSSELMNLEFDDPTGERL